MHITEHRKQELLETRKGAEEAIKIIDNLLNKEETLADVAKKYNVTPQKLNHELDSSKIKQPFNKKIRDKYLKQANITEEELLDCASNQMDWQDHLICLCLGYVDNNKIMFLPDYDKSIINDLYRKLPDLQQKVILYRFCEKYTLEETGQMMGYTREYIRQLENKAICNIRKNLDLAFPSLKEMESYKRAKALCKEVDKTRKDYQKYNAKLERAEEEKEKLESKGMIDISILPISASTVELLKHNGYNYVCQLENVTTDDLLQTSYVGLKKAQKIIKAYDSYKKTQPFQKETIQEGGVDANESIVD